MQNSISSRGSYGSRNPQLIVCFNIYFQSSASKPLSSLFLRMIVYVTYLILAIKDLCQGRLGCR
jgi:hypothetical protein